jgi:hypothetical protein
MIAKRRVLAPIVASAFAMALNAPPAAALVVSCTTKISDVSIQPWGTVYIRAVNLGWWNMCDLNSNQAVYVNGVSGGATTVTPTVCEAYVAKFLTAKTTQLNVTFYAEFGSATPPGCGDGYLGQWAIPLPYPYWIDFGG